MTTAEPSPPGQSRGRVDDQDREQAVGLGLRGRLVGVVATVLIVLFAACAVIAVVRAERALLEVDEGHARASARQLAAQAVYGALARSEALLTPVVDNFVRDPSVMRVVLSDEDGNTILERRGIAPPGPPLTVKTPIMTRAEAPGDDGELGAFGIASAEPRRVGTVQATFSRAAARDVERRLTTEFVIVFVVLGGVGLIIVLWLASQVVRRVRGLAAASASVADGTDGVRVDESGSDELGMLSRDFNAMAFALEQQREQLEDAAAALAERESLAAIGRANAVIAHELKNPLGIVLGATRILENESKSAESHAKATRIIGEEVRRLDVTLRELLDFARPRPPQKKTVDLAACAKDVVRRSTLPGGPAEEASVFVVGAEQAPVLADEQQLSQTLWNLIQNAVQAGAESVEVEIDTSDSGRVRAFVRDDGPGIASEIVANLFRPFVTTKQRGAGLGLAGAQRMMRDVGGDLRLVAEEKRQSGATFVIELERSEVADATSVRGE